MRWLPGAPGLAERDRGFVTEPASRAPGFATGSASRAHGFVTTQFVLAVALSLLLFVMACNAIVYQYARGVLRSALDEGVRSGTRATGSTGACEAAAEAVRRGLLGGPIGGHVELRCAVVNGQVRASAAGYLPSWLPGVPDWPIDLRASAVDEPFTAATAHAATTTTSGSEALP
jgi:hypothetical protein